MVSIPFMVDELALGDASERDIHATFGPFPPQLEDAYGFRVGGLISHEFFRPYALTVDFVSMRYLLSRSDRRESEVEDFDGATKLSGASEAN